MERAIYRMAFRADALPSWECPSCPAGTLHLVDGTFQKRETAASRAAHSDPDWDQEFARYTYSCLLECGNKNCGEFVGSVGTGEVDWDAEPDQYGQPQQIYVQFFRPLFFTPHLRLLQIPKRAPESVVRELDQSFALFFCNPPSAANHIRIALENLLTDLKVKRFNKDKKGKRVILNLHDRVNLLPKKYEELKNLCFAIKWLGNAGSHAGREVTIDTVMDAYDLMEPVLREIYDSSKKHAAKLATGIIKRKGPARKKRL